MVDLIDEFELLSAEEQENFSTLAQKTLDYLDLKDNSLTIVLSNDKNLQELNNQFSGNNYPTDVLSFTANEVDPVTGQNYLGDIIISFERAASQASDAHISISEELTTLIIHGVLHLNGYDHADEKGHKEMFTLQEKIINHLKDN